MLRIIERILLWPIILWHLFYYFQNREENTKNEPISTNIYTNDLDGDGTELLSFGDPIYSEINEHLLEKRDIRSIRKQERALDKENEERPANYENTTISQFEEVTVSNKILSESSAKKNNDIEFVTSNIVILNVTLLIFNVLNIDENAGIVTLSVTTVVSWKQPDFKKEHLTEFYIVKGVYILKSSAYKKIWVPDINIRQNLHEGKEHRSVTMSYDTENQIVSYDIREIVKLNCAMDYEYYPADTQRCNFTVWSHGSNWDRWIALKWRKNLSGVEAVRGVNLGDDNFEVQVESVGPSWSIPKNNDTYKFDFGVIRGLDFTMAARRKISYHIVQTYIPSFLYILITCLCFLVPSHMVEVRMGISMTTLLTLTAMFASVRESTPTVSYVKAIDIWMAFCIFFVFLTLLEFTTLLWLRSQREAAEKKRLENQKMLQALAKVIGGKSVTEPLLPEFQRNFSVESLQISRHERFAEVVEKYGVFVFSFVFITFTVIYWSWLITASEYYKWTINRTYNLIPRR